MSLTTDIIFVKALKSNTELMAELADGDVYNTFIAMPDSGKDNAELPYIVVAFDGLTNDQSNKDDYEGDTDSVQIGILMAAKTRPQLGQLAQAVRKTIHDYFVAEHNDDEDADMIPLDYQFSAKPVEYDTMKPCYVQEFTYLCDVKNSI